MSEREDEQSLEILAAGLQERVREEIERLRHSEPAVDLCHVKSPVTVDRGSRWDVRDILDVGISVQLLLGEMTYQITPCSVNSSTDNP